jgi:hypothetical protein
MMRNLSSRLERLERACTVDDRGPRRTVMGTSDADCEAQKAAMIEAGKASAEDEWMFIILVGLGGAPYCCG